LLKTFAKFSISFCTLSDGLHYQWQTEVYIKKIQQEKGTAKCKVLDFFLQHLNGMHLISMLDGLNTTQIFVEDVKTL